MSDYFNGVYRGVMDGSRATDIDLARKQEAANMIAAPLKMAGDMGGFAVGQKRAAAAHAQGLQEADAAATKKQASGLADYIDRLAAATADAEARKAKDLAPATNDPFGFLISGHQ